MESIKLKPNNWWNKKTGKNPPCEYLGVKTFKKMQQATSRSCKHEYSNNIAT